MRRLKRVMLLAAPLAGAVALLVPSSSYAASTVAGEVSVVGSGTITPGLGLTKVTQTVSFTGQVSGAIQVNTNNVVFANVTCNFTGSGSDNYVNGAGAVTGTCGGGLVLVNGTPTTGSASCSLAYNREGTTVLVRGTCSASGGGVSGSACANGEFEFVPTSVPTVTSYQLAGSVTLSPNTGSCPTVPKPPKVV